MKSKKLFLVIFFILIFVLNGCSDSYEHIKDPIQPQANTQNTKSETSNAGIYSIIEEGDKQTISVHYPVTGYSKVDEIISGFSLNRIELFRQETANIKIVTDENWPYELHINYEIAYQTSRHLSVLFTESKYLGALQSETTIYTYNFNLEQQRVLSLKDIFKGSSAYLEILSQYVYEALINKNILDLKLDKDWVTKGSTPLESNFKHFLLVEGGVKIFFEKYQLGPAFIGEPALSVPFDVFTAHIELKEESLNNEIVTETTSEDSDGTNPSTTEKATEDSTGLPIIKPNNSHKNENEYEPNERPKKKIAITFEDGPHPVYTPLILDTLKSRNEEATFFLIGNRAQDYSKITKRIYEEGHLIGNHSWSHPQLTRLSDDALHQELERTNLTIADITGFTPYLYRQPFGIYNESVLSIGDMPTILWSLDPLDLKYQDSEYIKNYILDHAFDGAIILLHDTNPFTTQALSAVIDGLVKDGFEIVSLEELLNLDETSAIGNTNIYSRGLEVTH